MNWKKKSRIYVPSGEYDWMQEFAMLPTPILLEDKLRVYTGFCTKDNVGRIGYVDVDPADPGKILYVSETPVLEIGSDGCFDDNGVVPVSVYFNEEQNKIYLYYIGFQKGVKVPYYMFCGLAVSDNRGDTFYRYSKALILDRTDNETFARCGVYVLKEHDIFKMWYIGSYKEGWTISNGKLRPLYVMEYMKSLDGIHWDMEPVECMRFQNNDEHGFGRPYVWKDDGIYKMMYSVRTYSRGYYIGYAESKDGIKWIRKDKEAGIELSDFGWDSENLSYPYLYAYKDQTYLFYNGNGCGKTGFGYAELVQW